MKERLPVMCTLSYTHTMIQLVEKVKVALGDNLSSRVMKQELGICTRSLPADYKRCGHCSSS